MFSSVVIDIDKDFDKFVSSDHCSALRERIYDMKNFSSAEIRRSASNHVHIRVSFTSKFSFFKSLCIRAYLDDDSARIACDLDRFYRTGKSDDTNRCFDKKYSVSKRIIKNAGVWEQF
jgi:hypothetical protein